MASTVCLGNISSSAPQLECSSAANHHHRHPKLQPPDITHTLFSADNTAADSMGSRFRKFSTAASNNQNLGSAEFEEVTETCKSQKKKVSDAVNQNQTLIAKNGNAEAGGESVQPESTQLGEKRKRTAFSTFSVSLTREKIEADLLAMGGSKRRSRRVTKRPKNLQTQLDCLFPGLRLKYITPDDYRVRNA